MGSVAEKCQPKESPPQVLNRFWRGIVVVGREPRAESGACFRIVEVAVLVVVCRGRVGFGDHHDGFGNILLGFSVFGQDSELCSFKTFWNTNYVYLTFLKRVP